MNILTKIGIVVLTVLVLLATPVFITHATLVPNYRDAFERQQTRANIQAQAAKHAELATARVTLELERLATAANKSKQQLQSDLDTCRSNLNDERERNTALQNKITSVVDDLKKLRIEYEKNREARVELRGKLEEANDKLVSLQGKYNDLDEENSELQATVVRAEALARRYAEQISAKDSRVRELEDQVNELKLKVASGGGTGEGTGTGEGDLPGDAGVAKISGQITAIQDDVASINIGSANGIKKGMELIIYRGATLVGFLRVEQVDAGQAAGVVFEKQVDPMQGDRVTTRVK